MADESDDWSLYPYEPNQGAPIAFAIIITLLGVALTYLSFVKYHWKKFGATMIWAAAVWVAGFICRSISVRQVQNVDLFIAQYVLVLVGPPLFAAAEYFILGRLFAYLPYFSPIHPGRVLSTFALLSTIVEVLTGNGASRVASANASAAEQRVGHNLLKAALLLQCFIEAFFFSLVVMLEYRCRKAKLFPRSIRTVCYVLYITSLMMLVRCITRAIEGFEACDPESDDYYCGTVSTHEWFLWVFEIANITLFVILLTIFHPGRYLPRSSKIYLDPVDGKTERMGPGFGKADKRPLWRTVLDPFDLTGIVTGKGMSVRKFWEEHHPIYDPKAEGRRTESKAPDVTAV